MNPLRKGDLYAFNIWLVLALSTVVIGVGTQAAKPRRERSVVAEVAQPSTYGSNFTGTVKCDQLNPQAVSIPPAEGIPPQPPAPSIPPD